MFPVFWKSGQFSQARSFWLVRSNLMEFCIFRISIKKITEKWQHLKKDRRRINVSVHFMYQLLSKLHFLASVTIGPSLFILTVRYHELFGLFRDFFIKHGILKRLTVLYFSILIRKSIHTKREERELLWPMKHSCILSKSIFGERLHQEIAAHPHIHLSGGVRATQQWFLVILNFPMVLVRSLSICTTTKFAKAYLRQIRISITCYIWQNFFKTEISTHKFTNKQ